MRPWRRQHRVLPPFPRERAGFHRPTQGKVRAQLEAKRHVRRTRPGMPDALQGGRGVRPPRRREARDDRVRSRARAASRHPGQAPAHGRRQGLWEKAHDAADDPREGNDARGPLAGRGGLNYPLEGRGHHPPRRRAGSPGHAGNRPGDPEDHDGVK